jgi:hypothetical protein
MTNNVIFKKSNQVAIDVTGKLGAEKACIGKTKNAQNNIDIYSLYASLRKLFDIQQECHHDYDDKRQPINGCICERIRAAAANYDRNPRPPRSVSRYFCCCAECCGWRWF